MKKFQFRLEQVLQQKITREEQALLEQAKAQQECVRCQQEIQSTTNKIEQALQYSETVRFPGDQMQSLLYLEHLKRTLDRQNRLLVRADELLQLRMKETLEARRERLVLDKLKENKLIEYKELEMHLEQKEIDELATLGFTRGNY